MNTNLKYAYAHWAVAAFFLILLLAFKVIPGVSKLVLITCLFALFWFVGILFLIKVSSKE